MFWVNFKIAIAAIKSTKIRSAMAMFAVIVGIWAFTIVTASVEGLKVSVTEQINSLGGNLIAITPGQSVVKDEEGNVESFNFAAAFGTSTLTEQDLKTVKEIEGVKAAAPQMLVSGTVQRGDNISEQSLIISTNSDYPAAFAQKVENGAFFEDKTKGNFVVVGSAVVEDLYGGDVTLGSKIEIRGKDFTIIGVMEEFESTGLDFGPDINAAVFIPLEAGKKFNNGNAEIMEIDAQIADGYDIAEMADTINEAIKVNHGGEEDFTVFKQEDFISATNNVLDIIKLVAQAVAVIMLLVAIIVIALIMWVIVNERIKEIGIRKSIGATEGNILTQFLIEALVLTWLGSFIGFVLALITGVILNNAFDITATFTLGTIIAVAIISTIAGALAGTVPAYVASRKDPVEALRHD